MDNCAHCDMLGGQLYADEDSNPFTFEEIIEFFYSLIDNSDVTTKFTYSPNKRLILIAKGTRDYLFTKVQ